MEIKIDQWHLPTSQQKISATPLLNAKGKWWNQCSPGILVLAGKSGVSSEKCGLILLPEWTPAAQQHLFNLFQISDLILLLSLLCFCQRNRQGGDPGCQLIWTLLSWLCVYVNGYSSPSHSLELCPLCLSTCPGSMWQVWHRRVQAGVQAASLSHPVPALRGPKYSLSDNPKFTLWHGSLRHTGAQMMM